MSSFPVPLPNFSHNLVSGRKWPFLGSYELWLFFFKGFSKRGNGAYKKISLCKISCQQRYNETIRDEMSVVNVSMFQ